MEKISNYIIENWWRHNGCYDREQASGRRYDGDDDDFLRMTDEWWESLTNDEKEEVYIEFFSEE